MFIFQRNRGGEGAINLAQVVAADRLGEKPWQVVSTDGQSRTVHDVDWQAALQTSAVSTFSAESGTYAVTIAETEQGTEVTHKIAIIGWALGYDAQVRPMVVDPSVFVEEWAILFPDGHVEAQHGEVRYWETLIDWENDPKRPR